MRLRNSFGAKKRTHIQKTIIPSDTRTLKPNLRGPSEAVGPEVGAHSPQGKSVTGN